MIFFLMKGIIPNPVLMNISIISGSEHYLDAEEKYSTFGRQAQHDTFISCHSEFISESVNWAIDSEQNHFGMTIYLFY